MTLMLAVAVRPTPSRTRRLSVWLPAATGVVSQKNEAKASPPTIEETSLPSMLSLKVIGVLNAPLAAMSIFVEPLTVAPAAGLLNEAFNGAVTVTVRLAVAVAPVPSRTVKPRV